MKRVDVLEESSSWQSNPANTAFISPRALGDLIGVEQTTLTAWRRRGIGPPWYRINGHLIRYERAEVLVWILSQKSTHRTALKERRIEGDQE